IPNAVVVTDDLQRALEADALVVAAPAQGIRELRDRVGPLLRPSHRLCSATKGLTPDDSRRMSELWADAMPASRVAVLSGPNISREIAAGLPAPTVIASTDPETARGFQALLDADVPRLHERRCRRRRAVRRAEERRRTRRGR